jgi:hypothetical protein
MKATSFVFYESFRDASRNLDDATRLALYEAIMDYSLYGEEPDEGNPVAAAMFKLVRPVLDTNAKRRENGRNGGRPASTDNQEASKPEPENEKAESETEAKENPVETEDKPVENQSETKPEPNHNQEVTKTEPDKIYDEDVDGDKDVDVDIYSTPPTSPLRGSGRKKSTDMDGFALFWQEYPRKAAKAAALKAWQKLNPSPELVERILAHVRDHKRSQDWIKDGGQFVPYPATFLNGRRWEDDIPPDTGPGMAYHGYHERTAHKTLEDTGTVVDLDQDGAGWEAELAKTRERRSGRE